ncbi:CBU_0592 family membrane protein [Frigoribacterium sp. 2-23]|uniref:CBU_0592 family membrane protein n=1 Tax=Frigoribacterium sp. 2-23 TaxID=3415006 RepID=UPI003C6F7CB4
MVFEVLGWVGAIVILAGYALFSLGKIANGPLYQWTNLIGGVAVSINVSHHGAYPSMIVNTIWALIAATVLVRMYRKRHAAVRVERAAEAARIAEEARVAAQPAPTTSPVPLVESVPVITAALAVVTLAAVAHAAEQAEQAEHAEQAEPERADA